MLARFGSVPEGATWFSQIRLRFFMSQQLCRDFNSILDFHLYLRFKARCRTMVLLIIDKLGIRLNVMLTAAWYQDPVVRPSILGLMPLVTWSTNWNMSAKVTQLRPADPVHRRERRSNTSVGYACQSLPTPMQDTGARECENLKNGIV